MGNLKLLKSRLFIFLVFLAVIFASTKTQHTKGIDTYGTKINWMSYSSGITQAKARNHSIFLFFYADWCFNCAKMEKETFQDNSIIEYLNAHFISIKIKFDREQKIANEYHVRGLPTIVLVDPNDNSSRQLPGFFSADRLMGLLKEYKCR